MTDLSEPVRAIIEANQSERFKRLDSLEAHVSQHQYDGRPSWWTDKVPAWERKPCIRYGVIASAIRDNASLIAGESRFPRVTTRPAEQDVLDETGLTAQQSAVFDAHLRQLQKRTKFRPHVRSQLRAGQGCGTIVGLFGIRNGRPYAETTRAKWCMPTLDSDGRVTKLEIRYCFVKEVRQSDRSLKQEAWVFRRVLDSQTDTSWEGLARQNGEDPEWRKLSETKHGLGRCPAVWHRFLADCSTHDEIDGEAIFDESTAELIQANDLALSQRHRSALYLEPQWTEAGVEPGYVPTEPGRAANVLATVAGGKVTSANPVTGVWNTGGPKHKGTRKKGPGHVWQYADPGVKVQLHQANADALAAISAHCEDLEAKIAEALAVVFLDPNRVKYASALSGRALKMLRQRQIDRADEIRDDFGDGYLVPALEMLLYIEAVCLTRGDSVRVPGAKQVFPILAKALGGSADNWEPPELTLIWGAYADSDPTEDLATVTATKDARSERLIPRHSAVSKLAPIFGIEDVEAACKEIDKEAEEDRKRQSEQTKEQLKAEAAAYHDHANGSEDSPRPDAQRTARGGAGQD